jgi:undecaprenyl-diphosphatase
VKAIGAASEIGDQPPLYAICGAIIAAGLVLDDPRTLRAGARMMAAHVVAIVLKSAFKHSIDRTRPDLIAEGRYKLGKGERDEHDFNSFPSGHTASSIAVARAVGREYPGLHGAALATASAVAVTQVVRSAHYVSDIVAGAAVGLVAEKAIDAAFRRFHPDVD